ncbi:UDP-glycosyltransferase UGT4-like [Culicoides brevitarsis]|uniref:UDP-glycosyltransferase UGT4-like n=1 Tax=Culicoides brevitarsis TaxID=469753 RepID=UPI00307BFD5D
MLVMKLNILSIFVLIFAQNVDSARILCFYPTPSKSGVLIAQPLMEELAKRGHEVTFVSPFPLGKSVPNYRDVVISVKNEATRELTQRVTSKEQKHNILTWLPKLVTLSSEATIEVIKDEKFQEIMKKEKFDLIVFGYLFNNFQLGLQEHFNCSSVVLSSAPFFHFLEELLGHPNNPEAVRSIMLKKDEEMTGMNFFERVLNTLAYFVEHLMFIYVEYRNQFYFDEIFPESKLGYSNAKKNVSLVLVNQYLSEGWIRPLLPSVIEVGGLQIKETPSPLPDDIQKFIESSKDGVVLVSFGTNFRSIDLQQEKLSILMKSFSKLEQKVIWKFENETLPNLPKNVLIKTWLPQDDILAHPNTKAFVTHCGISSYNEALFHAVPIVAIPFVSDQPMNAKRAKDAGWAEIVPFLELTEEKLDAALTEILKNPKFKKNVKVLSDKYRDRPITAMQSAIYWIEYVIRHEGAPQLRYPGINLNYFQQRGLDIFAFLTLFLFVLVKGTKFVCQKLRNCTKKGVDNRKRHDKKNN